MRKLAGWPFAAVGAMIATYGGLTGDLAFAVLGIIVTVASLALGAMLNARKERRTDVLEGLGNEERILLKPIRRLQGELEAIASSAESETARVIAREAVIDAETIFGQALKLVRARSEMKKTLFSAGSTKELEKLRRQIADAPPGEREKLEVILSAREREAGHYQELQAALAKIDTSLRQAEATLSEIKAKLTVSVTFPDERDEDTRLILQDSMDRLRSLSVSFDEAEEFLRGHSG